ncbi:MGDG synthase family glycosyltransferase [Paenibacillus apis]|nr:glycosyltransferase [Paenibacillus apis]
MMQVISMLKKQTVLILSEGFGCGHTQAAHALAAGLEITDSRIQARVLELGSFLNPRIAPMIHAAYRTAISTNPGMIGKLYRNQYEKPLGGFSVLALHKLFYSQAYQTIQELKPDFIICTHPIPCAIVSRLKESGLEIPMYTLITDYDAHSSWIHPGVDCYFVSTPEVRSLLMQRGVRSEAIQVTGIPVHPDFWTKQDKGLVRSQLELADLPTVMMMGGGWGLLYNEALIKTISAWREHVQFICCTGSNDKLAARLNRLTELQHPHIRVLGFTTEISKWMDASDLLVTKAGGMTCTESMAKRLPMLFYDSIPGQELKNQEYFVKNGYGLALSSTDLLDQLLAQACFGARQEGGSPMAEICKFTSRSTMPSPYRPDLCIRQIAGILMPGTQELSLSQAYL